MLFCIPKEKTQTVQLREIVNAVFLGLLAVPVAIIFFIILILNGSALLSSQWHLSNIFQILISLIFVTSLGLLILDIIIIPLAILVIWGLVLVGWVGPFSAISAGFALPALFVVIIALATGSIDTQSIYWIDTVAFFGFQGAFWALVTWVIFYFMRPDLYRRQDKINA